MRDISGAQLCGDFLRTHLEIPGQFLSRRPERQDEECAGPATWWGHLQQCSVVCPSSSRTEYSTGIDGQLLWREYTANREEVASACATQRPGITGHGETRLLGVA